MNAWENLDDIGWYPGHMAKAKRYIAENLKLVDFCIELRDSRIPRSSRNPGIAKLIDGRKKIVLLTKCSLSDPNVTRQWIEKLAADGEIAIPIDSKTLMGLDAFTRKFPEVMAEKLDFYKRKNMAKPLRAMVLGVTNVGKSTFFNAISRTKKAKVEDRPGVTRTTQWIRTPFNLELLDTPGLLWEKISSKESAFMLAATGAIRDEVFNTVEISQYLCAFLAQQYPNAFTSRFKLDSPEGTGPELFEAVARKRGFLMAGGVIDEERCAKCLLDEFRGGKIGRISMERP